MCANELDELSHPDRWILDITLEILSLIARIDEFKGAWRALGTLAPDRLSALRRVATIESIGSSTRIEGSKLSGRGETVETLPTHRSSAYCFSPSMLAAMPDWILLPIKRENNGARTPVKVTECVTLVPPALSCNS